MAQMRHQPMVKLKKSAHINSTNHTRSLAATAANSSSTDTTIPPRKHHTLKRMERSAFTIRLNYSTVSVVKSDEKPARNDSNHSQRPLFAAHRKYEKLAFDPSVYVCNDKHSIDCLNRTKEFRAKVRIAHDEYFKWNKKQSYCLKVVLL